jgi:hypothetical protein
VGQTPILPLIDVLAPAPSNRLISTGKHEIRKYMKKGRGTKE